MKIPENVMNAIDQMFLCNSMIEHLACYQHFYEDLQECTFVVFSEREGTKLPEPLCTNFDNDFAIINIGCADRFYAVNRQIYEEMIMTGRSDFGVDVCLELDTQAVSYIKNIFVEYNQISDYAKMKNLIEYLQFPGLNYSGIPYLVENAAKKDVINKIECYKNIKSFMLFKSFKYSKFLQSGTCEYDKQEAEILLDADDLYNDIFSEKFALAYKDFIKMQNALYALLLKAIYIEFNHSNKSAQNKIMELFDFVNEYLGFIAERELEICYYYFMHDEKTKKFFKRAQRNSKDILNTINGMAWDLIHIRLVEWEFEFRPIDEVKFAIHVLLTFDNGLKEILQINPIEQIAIYRGVTHSRLKHAWIDKIPGAKEKLLSEENKQRRRQTLEKMDVDELKAVLESELLVLCNDRK